MLSMTDVPLALTGMPNGHGMTAIFPAPPPIASITAGPTTNDLRFSGSTSSISPHTYIVRSASELPRIDLSCTLARTIFKPQTHRRVVVFLRRHFHHLSWGFRIGVLCFGAILFVEQGPFRSLLVAVLVPATVSLFATVLFMSLDVLRLLSTSYEFWFTTIINTINWTAFALALGDSRALMSFMGSFSFQIVISSDASYRTMSTIVRSAKLGIPVALLMCACVSLRAIENANFFVIKVVGHRVYDAADIMNFTGPTLAILLAKMIVLKYRRAHSHTGNGYLTVKCVVMKATLRLVPVQTEARVPLQTDIRRSTHGHVRATPRLRKQRGHPYVTRSNGQQHVRLSPLPLTRVDAHRTLLPSYLWRAPPEWILRHQNLLRLALYAFGGIGFFLLAVQTYHNVHSLVAGSQTTLRPTTTLDGCSLMPLTRGDRVRAIAAYVCSCAFYGVFALFFQRDLLRVLLGNFDFAFSLAQFTAYNVSVLDMLCWQPDHVLVVLAWMNWVVWTLSMDALTPLAKRALRLPHALPATVLAASLLIGLGLVYVVLFVDENGLRNRTIVDMAISHHTFALSTRSVMLGRVATIALWSSRQVFVLFARRDDELHLVRGLVEYASPYGFFPAHHTRHRPARADDDDI